VAGAARLTQAFFERSVHDVAPELIGAELYVDGAGGTTGSGAASGRPRGFITPAFRAHGS